jgi:tetratricopeptide (TPR) repeat protein
MPAMLNPLPNLTTLRNPWLLAFAAFTIPLHLLAQPHEARSPLADMVLTLCADSSTRSLGWTNATKRAVASVDSLRARYPKEATPLVQRARLISECEMQTADILRNPVLARRAIDLLQRALAIDSAHWEARYTLALNYFYAPEFLGQTPDAVREFEHLLRQHGKSTVIPEMAAPYTFLGDLYQRDGRKRDAEAIWKRGIALFPNDERLKKRLLVNRPVSP